LMPGDPQLNSVGAPANKGYWQRGTEYRRDDVVFVFRDPGIPPATGFLFTQLQEPKFLIAYKCILPPGVVGTSSGVGGGPTASAPEQRISDNDVLWESFDNRVPLTTIRMTLRYINETTGDPRQLTLVLPVGP